MAGCAGGCVVAVSGGEVWLWWPVVVPVATPPLRCQDDGEGGEGVAGTAKDGEYYCQWREEHACL